MQQNHQGQEQEYNPIMSQPLSEIRQSVPLGEQLRSSLRISSRMPPSLVKKNLLGLVKLAPDLTDHLYEKIQVPMKISQESQKPFLETEFNRDGDCYRSPYDNKYYPENHNNCYRPTGVFLKMQQQGQTLFEDYRKLYYGQDSYCNFYVTQGQNQNNFSCGFFAKKIIPQSQGFSGGWDSFNIVDVTIDNNVAHYKLSSTVLLEMKINDNKAGGIDLTGFNKHQEKLQLKLKENVKEQEKYLEHLVVIGQMIENSETKLRRHLESVYTAKTKEIIYNCRVEETIQMETHKRNLAQDLKNISFEKKTQSH